MKKVLIVILSLVLVTLLVCNYTKALYVSDSIWNYYLNSKGFYFESEYLGNNKINTYNLWDGGSISFNLKNNLNGKYMTDDISYEIECKTDSSTTCEIQNQGSNKYTSEIKGGSSNAQTIYFDVASPNEDVLVQIIAKSISPYKKTITGTFKLHKVENTIGNLKYELVDYNNYSVLNISNYYDQDKCLNIKWDNIDIRVSSDILNPATDTLGHINEFDVNVPKHETIGIKFYNLGTDSFDESIFNIVECVAS